MSVRLLGRFAVTIDEAEVGAGRWPGLRAAHLVQLLCLAPQHRLRREQITEALWPDLSPEAGAANLRKTVHHVRQALGRHDALLADGNELVLWSLGELSVDIEIYEAKALAALAVADRDACRQVADSWGGDLLPGSAYEGWTLHTRERLQARQVELLRISRQWERLTELDPLDEPAYRELMVRELAGGNRSAAIRWYSRLRDALQHQLGVRPDHETEALHARCVAGVQQERPAFVGRGEDLAQVEAWLDLPISVRPGGLMIRGSAGIGKTAFCSQIEDVAGSRGWSVIRLQASQVGHSHAVMTALTERLLLPDRGLLDRIGAPARAVLALLSPLAGPAETLQGSLGRHQVIGAIRRLLVAAGNGDSIMLQVDDAHLADDAEIEVLMQLCCAGPPIFVVLSMRPPPVDSQLARSTARLAAAGPLRILDLTPLTAEESGRLVTLSARSKLAPPMLAHIVQEAGGNPFAAIELTRCAEQAGTMRLPQTIRAAVIARLCDLPEAAMATLKWMALAGDVFSAVDALALTPDAESHAFGVLDLALDAGVLVLTGSDYRFRHELVRQALIEEIAPHQRLKIHRQAARRLTELDAAPSLIARHWLEGGQPRAAIPALLAAAREALRLAAFSDALRHLETLLAHQSGHLDALCLRAEALDAMGDARAVAAYREAAEVSGEPGAHDLRAKGALAQIKQGDPKGALQALQGVRPTTPQGLLCEALAWSGAAALGVADPAVGTEKAAQARKLAIQAGDNASLVIASWAHAAAAHARGELRQSVWADLHELRHLPELATRVFDGQLCMTQRFLYGARPYSEVIAFAARLTDEAERIGAARGHAFGVTIRGEAELLAGDLSSADQHLHRGVELHRKLGAATGEAFALQRLADLALYRGQADKARALLDESLDVARQSDVGFHLLDRIYGTRIIAAPDVEAGLHAVLEAREMVRGPLETCPGCRITFAVPAAIAAARAGQNELAEEYAQQSAYLAEVVMRLPAWHAAHEEVRAHLARMRGEGVRSATLFESAARGFDMAGQPLDAARCQVLAMEGRRDE